VILKTISSLPPHRQHHPRRHHLHVVDAGADAALARARRRLGGAARLPSPAAAAEAAAEAAREAEGAAAAADAVDDAPLAVECRAQAAAAAAAAAALRRGAAPTAVAKAAELRGAGGDGGAAKRACAATLADLRAERLRTEWVRCRRIPAPRPCPGRLLPPPPLPLPNSLTLLSTPPP